MPKSFGKAATRSPNDYNGTLQIRPKTAPSLRRSPPHLIHPSLDRPNSPSQTASGSNQPFCHSTLSGQIDRQTDRWERRQHVLIRIHQCADFLVDEGHDKFQGPHILIFGCITVYRSARRTWALLNSAKSKGIEGHCLGCTEQGPPHFVNIHLQ